MKSKLKFILFTLILGVFTSSSVFAQSNTAATISSDNGITLSLPSSANGITLSQTNLLEENYDIDISDKGWTQVEAQSAIIYFMSKSNLINLELDYPNQKFILTLDLDAPQASNWGFGQWSEHLVTVR
jgi:hypothetical protein